MSMNPAIAASAPVGKYTLEVGAYAASSAQFAPSRSKPDKAQALANARALRAALAKPETAEPVTPLEELEQIEASGRAVTDRVEHANNLFKAAAENRLLDRDVLTGEIGALLGLLHRLDREGRYEEEIRVAKALHGLCVLAFRWLDLLRSLRAALAAARAAGDEAAQAWALNELGALHLCAGAPRKAREHLEEALALQEKLGDVAGRCGTRHNLDSARRDIARPIQMKAPRPLVAVGSAVGSVPWRRVFAVKFLAVLVLLLATPPAVAWFAGRGGGADSGLGPTTTIGTDTETGPSGGGMLDVTLRRPGMHLSGSERLEATIGANGDGVHSVAFQWAPAADPTDWTTIARDRDPPYAVPLKSRLLPDGHYRLRALASNDEGDHASVPVAVVIDNTPPRATVSGTGFLRGDGVQIAVDASDALSGIRDTVVEYSDGGEDAWATVPTPWATTGLEDGPYDLRVRATDNAGNKTTSKSVTRWIDNDDPDVEITAPTDFINATDAAAATYTVRGAAAARDVMHVEFFRCADDTEACSSGNWVSLGTDETRPYEASWTVDEDGTRALQAVAVDKASNKTSDVVNVVIDRAAPIRGTIGGEAVWQGADSGYRVDLKVGAARDFGSGVNAESQLVTRRAGTWVTGVKGFCTLEPDATTVDDDLPPYDVSDTDVESERCYVYVYEVKDNAGNLAQFPSSSVLVPEPPPG